MNKAQPLGTSGSVASKTWAQLGRKTPSLRHEIRECRRVRPTDSTGLMVGAVGIELKVTLKTRKLLILLNAKNAKSTGFAQPRYTRGTWRLQRIESKLQEHWHPKSVPRLVISEVPKRTRDHSNSNQTVTSRAALPTFHRFRNKVLAIIEAIPGVATLDSRIRGEKYPVQIILEEWTPDRQSFAATLDTDKLKWKNVGTPKEKRFETYAYGLNTDPPTHDPKKPMLQEYGPWTCTSSESATWWTASKNLWSRSTSGCSSWALPTYIPRFQNLRPLALKFGVIAGWSSNRAQRTTGPFPLRSDGHYWTTIECGCVPKDELCTSI
jgi:hypothetical protein